MYLKLVSGIMIPINTQTLIIILCTSFSRETFTSTTSLNTVKENFNSSIGYIKESDKHDLQWKEIFAQEVPREAPARGISQNTNVERAITKNPCILTKIVSYLDVSSVRFIVSKELIGLPGTLASCVGLLGGSISKSVVLIDKTIVSLDHLKMNVLQYFSRDIRCFIVMCGEVCSSILLLIAEANGFGAEVYFWVTISSPALTLFRLGGV